MEPWGRGASEGMEPWERGASGICILILSFPDWFFNGHFGGTGGICNSVWNTKLLFGEFLRGLKTFPDSGGWEGVDFEGCFRMKKGKPFNCWLWIVVKQWQLILYCRKPVNMKGEVVVVVVINTEAFFMCSFLCCCFWKGLVCWLEVGFFFTAMKWRRSELHLRLL